VLHDRLLDQLQGPGEALRGQVVGQVGGGDAELRELAVIVFVGVGQVPQRVGHVLGGLVGVTYPRRSSPTACR
jgi:hypothetical protein